MINEELIREIEEEEEYEEQCRERRASKLEEIGMSEWDFL